MKHTSLKAQKTKYYVFPHPRGWAVRSENISPVSYSYVDKKEAINTAISLAEKHHSEVVIQNKDGSIENKLSFS